MVEILLWVGLFANPPSALGNERPVPVISLASGLRVRVDKSPNRLQGDFNNDGKIDTLQIVAVDTPPPTNIKLLSPWGIPKAFKPPIALALYIRHGGKAGEFLLHNRDYLDTPTWREAKPLPISVVKKGTPDYRSWQRQLPKLRGDAILLPTEAGIDILLYWDGSTYRVYFPPEIP
jgi:hypothetical protein